MVYADGKYDVALEKIKHSFALKACFVARSIRLAVRIVRGKKVFELYFKNVVTF